MSDTGSQHVPSGGYSQPGPPDPAAEQDSLDALEQMREHLASVSAGDVVAEAAVPLVTLAYVRLGVPPGQNEEFRDLEAARLLIDALAGLLDAVRGRLGAVERELRDALAGLQMAYVDVLSHTQADHTQAGQPRAGEPESPRPEPPPAGRRPSGLWVPGQS